MDDGVLLSGMKQSSVQEQLSRRLDYWSLLIFWQERNCMIKFMHGNNWRWRLILVLSIVSTN
jgi:hypothetical protein